MSSECMDRLVLHRTCSECGNQAEWHDGYWRQTRRDGYVFSQNCVCRQPWGIPPPEAEWASGPMLLESGP